MKSLIILCLFAHLATASTVENLKVIGRIQHKQNGLTLIRSIEGDAIPGMLHHQDLGKIISSLQPGDEVIVEGHISYVPSSIDGKSELKPIFVMTSIKPISLARIGVEGDMGIEKQQLNLIPEKVYSPMAIPVTTEVASAITLTTSLLLMQSLTASEADPAIRQQLNSGLIFFAGVMATGVFIYEQLKSTKK